MTTHQGEYDSSAVEAKLRDVLSAAEADTGPRDGGWDPVLDSMSVAQLISEIKSLLPWTPPGDKLVRPGGYHSAEAAVADVMDRLKKAYSGRAATKQRTAKVAA